MTVREIMFIFFVGDGRVSTAGTEDKSWEGLSGNTGMVLDNEWHLSPAYLLSVSPKSYLHPAL